MINLSPKLAQAAARAELEEVRAKTNAWRRAIDALESLPARDALAVHEELAERWPNEFGEARDKVRELVARDAEIARLKAEIAAMDAWLTANKTLRGKKLLDACAALTVKHPRLFAEDLDVVRKIAALQIETDEARMYDVRKVGFGPADFPYHPPSRVER